MITHLQPDILECEVKWALGGITTKKKKKKKKERKERKKERKKEKASGGDGIPAAAELFQILKDDSVKVLHSSARKFGKLSSGHRT